MSDRWHWTWWTETIVAVGPSQFGTVTAGYLFLGDHFAIAGIAYHSPGYPTTEVAITDWRNTRNLSAFLPVRWSGCKDYKNYRVLYNSYEPSAESEHEAGRPQARPARVKKQPARFGDGWMVREAVSDSRP